MARYAAMLRGVSPMNCKMPALKAAFEKAGFDDVKTVISSGNVVFSARACAETTLQKKCEDAMDQHLGRVFMTIVRPVDQLRDLIAANPWKKFTLPDNAKRNVTFLREKPAARMKLPVEIEGSAVLALIDREVFSYYVPNRLDIGPDFMQLIEKTFGKAVTTRTWDTVGKLAR